MPTAQVVVRLNFRSIVISWSESIRYPLALAHDRLNGRAYMITQCPIELRRIGTRHGLVVPAGFVFDGASIPRLFWIVPGFHPFGKHVWAALYHDWLCEHPEELPRTIADAVFATLLVDTGVDGRRAVAMSVAVWAYGVWRAVRSWIR